MKIARFHGSNSEWPDFLATFPTIIANVDELSDIKKLQYLRSSLGGVALETIRSVEPSNVNYKMARNLLVNGFDNSLTLSGTRSGNNLFKGCREGIVEGSSGAQ